MARDNGIFAWTARAWQAIKGWWREITKGSTDDIVVDIPELPTPPIGEDDDDSGTKGVSRSNNNSLSGQTNIARLGQRIPQIYGRVRCFPDLASSPYIEYSSNTQVVEQYHISHNSTISNFLVIDPKIGDLKNPSYLELQASGVPSIEWKKYVEGVTSEPIPVPTSDTVGDTMRIPIGTGSSGATITAGTAKGSNLIQIVDNGTNTNPNEFVSKMITAFKNVTPGDVIGLVRDTLDEFYTVEAIEIEGFELNGAGALVNQSIFRIYVVETVTANPAGLTEVFFHGVNIIGDYDYNNGSPTVAPITGIDIETQARTPADGVTPWYAIVNFITDQGWTFGESNGPPSTIAASGNLASAAYTIIIKLDGVIYVTIPGLLFEGNFYGFKGQSVKLGPFTTPSNLNERISFTIFPTGLSGNLRRQLTSIGNDPDWGENANVYYPIPINNNIAWEYDMKIANAGVWTEETYPFGYDADRDVAVAKMILTSGGVRGRVGATDRLNYLVQPRVANLSDNPDEPYTAGPGTTDSFPGTGTTANPTAFYNAFITHANLNGINEDEIDFQTLIDIKNSPNVNDPSELYFAYTFSTNSVAIDQELQTICAAAQCTLVYDRGQYKVYRDEAREVAGVLIGRNILGDYTESITPYIANGYDGIELEYINPDTEKLDSVLYPAASTNPQRIRTAGIQNEEQALRRVQYEWKRNVYQRQSLTIEVNQEGLLYDVYDRVQVEDLITNQTIALETGNVYCEVTDVELDFYGSGDTDLLTLSEVYRFDPGASGSHVFAVAFYAITVDGTKTVYKDSLTQLVLDDGTTPDINDPNPYPFRKLRCTVPTEIRSAISEAVRNYDKNQIGVKIAMTRYFDNAVVPTGNDPEDFDNWLVVGKQPTENRTVILNLVNYDERIYDYTPV